MNEVSEATTKKEGPKQFVVVCLFLTKNICPAAIQSNNIYLSRKMSVAMESTATDDGECETEDFELLEQKLENTAMTTMTARKSGPGRAWPPQNNSHCGVLNCPSTTATCQDLWFFKLPLHSNDSER